MSTCSSQARASSPPTYVSRVRMWIHKWGQVNALIWTDFLFFSPRRYSAKRIDEFPIAINLSQEP